MESSRLPALRPSTKGAEALVAYFVQHAKAGLEHLAANNTRNKKDWTEQYFHARDKFLKEGSKALWLEAGITNITRGTRTRAGMRVTEYTSGLFTELDSDDIETVSVEVTGIYSRISSIEVTFTRWETVIRMQTDTFPDDGMGGAPSMDELERVLQEAMEPWVDTPPAPLTPPPFRVFIGHGGDQQWRDLKDALRDRHHFDVDAFEAMTRTSQVISEIVQGMATGSTAAVLVFTKADKMADGTWRARQNVVHEAGYFQGRLGWERTILVVEEGVVLPSNFDGTQHIRFPSGVISAAEGPVTAALQEIRNRPIGICI